jgi:hypothetical protein
MNPFSCDYLELYSTLKQSVSFLTKKIPLLEGLTLENYNFVSQYKSQSLSDFKCPGIPAELSAKLPSGTDISSLFVTIDDDILENRFFSYHLIHPKTINKAQGLIILLHGFNERNWDKYLPWAAHLAAKTSKSVLLFPISFHMNRAPELWVNTRIMQKVSQWRKMLFPNIIQSTLSNAAISERLHQNPARFFWSGLETYQNIIELVKFIKNGSHPGIEPLQTIDFFTYSIGTFLGTIIMMTNQENLFSKTKFFAFCGGPVFNRLSPVSKFILDSEANVRLYSFLVEHLESHRRKDLFLDHFLETEDVGINFRALLNYRLDLAYREDKLKQLASQFFAVTLAKDEVVPPFEVVNTFQGNKRDIGIPVEILDPTYPYRHEDPFPATEKHQPEINKTFEQVFDMAAEFLK